jgi:diguanylate cyclase (GGDEF)-like protein/PAS domain S-box-containing protein
MKKTAISNAAIPPINEADIHRRASEALRQGDFDLADRLLASDDVELASLIENLRIYQAELEIQNSELREEQARSQQSLDRFSSLFAHLPLAEVLIDRTGLILEANVQAASLFALNNTHLRQYYLRRLLAPGAEHQLAEAMRLAQEAGVSSISPVTFNAADGHVFQAELHLAALPTLEDECGQFVCAVVDISERLQHEADLKAANERLRESETRYRILADYSPDWDYWMGPDGRFKYVSPACESICGYPAQAFLDDADLFCQLLHPEDHAAWHDHLHAASTTQHCAHDNLLLRLIDASGNLRWLEHQCTSVFDEDGRYLGRRGVNRNVTQRIQAEAEACHVSRLLKVLSAVNQLITREQNESVLIEQVCRVAVEMGGLKASLVAIQDPLSGQLWAHAWSGDGNTIADDGLPKLEQDYVLLPSGERQPMGQPLACNDSAPPDLDADWCAWLSHSGVGAVIHFPLVRENKTIGLMSFFADGLAFLRADVCALLSELASDLSYALDSFDHRRLEFEARFKLADREAHLQALTQTAPLGLGVITRRVFTDVNARLCDMVGYQASELLGESTRFVYPDDAEFERVGREEYAEIAATGLGQIETRWQRQDGQIIDVQLISSAFDRDDLSKGVVFIAEDVTQRKQHAIKLKRAYQQLEMAVEAGNLGIYDFDLRSGKISINACYLQMLGYAPDELELTHETWLKMIHPDDLPAVKDAFIRDPNQILAGVEVEYRMRHKSGAWVWLLDRAKGYMDHPEAGISRAIGTHIDLTARKQAEEKLDFLSHFDALTHLPNRELLRDRLEHGIQRVHRENQQLAILMLDLDRFKTINESLGHSVGDALLQALTVRMLGQIRGGDTLARVGGDEFILLLEDDVNAHSASAVALKWLDMFKQPIRVGESELAITASIGISLYPADGENADDLLRHADAALYKAKSQGRNTYQFFEQAMTAGAFEHLLMENALRGAVSRDELRVHYQPQLDLASGNICGVEALVRWQHPELGLVMPGRFIPLAEEAGIIGLIGEWVLREACRQIKVWDDAGLFIPCVAVNLSVQQIERNTLVQLVADALASFQLDGCRLELEVTESMIMCETDKALVVLQDLRTLGVKLAIDDFGTGYSSLSYLKRLPMHRLKIDQSFVSDIGLANNGEAIVRAIIALGHSMGLEIVAEGVEYQHQADFLRLEGCDVSQGYLYSRPLEPNALAALIPITLPG